MTLSPEPSTHNSMARAKKSKYNSMARAKKSKYKYEKGAVNTHLFYFVRERLTINANERWRTALFKMETLL